MPATPNAIRFTFDSDFEGWIPGDLGGFYDSAMWQATDGNPGGCIALDGSDLGTPDGQANSWIELSLSLPTTAKRLHFDTSANVDGELRVVARDSLGGELQTVLDWEVLAGPEWRAREADIRAFAGREATFYFEQGDNDIGGGEHRYIDNVVFD